MHVELLFAAMQNKDSTPFNQIQYKYLSFALWFDLFYGHMAGNRRRFCVVVAHELKTRDKIDYHFYKGCFSAFRSFVDWPKWLIVFENNRLFALLLSISLSHSLSFFHSLFLFLFPSPLRVFSIPQWTEWYRSQDTVSIYRLNWTNGNFADDTESSEQKNGKERQINWSYMECIRDIGLS